MDTIALILCACELKKILTKTTAMYGNTLPCKVSIFRYEMRDKYNKFATEIRVINCKKLFLINLSENLQVELDISHLINFLISFQVLPNRFG